MKQKLHLQPIYRQSYILTQQGKQALAILKMDHAQVVRLLVQSVQHNPFVKLHFFNDDESSILDRQSTKPSLQADLYYQLHTCGYAYDETICNFLIESLDTHGFLSMDELAYCTYLQVDKQHFHESLTLLQSFEPTGVAAYDAIDALILQCQRDGYKQGINLLSYHREHLIQHDYGSIAKAMHVSIKQVKEFVQLLRAYHPYPCYEYEHPLVEYRLPEVAIIVDEGEISIEPIKVCTFSINENYIQKIEKNQQLKAYFKDAKILFETINKRNVTLLMIVNELILIQQGFFLYQDELQPCTMNDIAQRLGMNESTISRALANKYFIFQDETYPFKMLFTSSNAFGNSGDSIQKAMQMLLQREDKEHPLSDQQITIKLSTMDICSTRRTITKYRQLLAIPSSSQRKQMYKRKGSVK